MRMLQRRRHPASSASSSERFVPYHPVPVNDHIDPRLSMVYPIVPSKGVQELRDRGTVFTKLDSSLSW